LQNRKISDKEISIRPSLQATAWRPNDLRRPASECVMTGRREQRRGDKHRQKKAVPKTRLGHWPRWIFIKQRCRPACKYGEGLSERKMVD